MLSKEGFFNLPAPLLTAVGTVLGFALLGRLDYNQQNALGNWLMLIGQILETSSAQSQLLSAGDDLDSRRLDALEQQIKRLQQQLEQLKGES